MLLLCRLHMLTRVLDHKNFCHGVTVMGTPFPRPTRTRALADDKGWEGFCESCSEWIVLNGGKKSHTSWFRHAYKVNLLVQNT
jgi:hypothetical protein